MESSSKMKPERSTTGRKAESSAAKEATYWFLESVEMIRPCPSADIMKSDATAKRASREPRNGTPKSHTARARLKNVEKIARRQ